MRYLMLFTEWVSNVLQIFVMWQESDLPLAEEQHEGRHARIFDWRDYSNEWLVFWYVGRISKGREFMHNSIQYCSSILLVSDFFTWNIIRMQFYLHVIVVHVASTYHWIFSSCAARLNASKHNSIDFPLDCFKNSTQYHISVPRTEIIWALWKSDELQSQEEMMYHIFLHVFDPDFVEKNVTMTYEMQFFRICPESLPFTNHHLLAREDWVRWHDHTYTCLP